MIAGGQTLEGTVRTSGSKNAVLPVMAAGLLTSQPLRIRNAPQLADVDTMMSVLRDLDCEAEREADGSVFVRGAARPKKRAAWDNVRKMRGSVAVLGPLLTRTGRAEVSLPGGCVFGVRPVDQHVRGLNALGARIETSGGYLVSEAGADLHGADLFLGTRFGSSVLATDNVLMAAVLAKGTTRLENAAMEPEVAELCRLLVAMGARIEGIGGHRLVVHGVERLHGAEHVLSGDRIEAGTFLVGAAMTRGDVTVEGVESSSLTILLETLREMDVEVQAGDDWVRAATDRPLQAVDVTTMPFPGFPTDLQAQVMAALTVARGLSVVTERIFPDRFMHVAELLRLGADVRKEGPQAIIQGRPGLSGATVMASDLRASAALVLAGLVADGTTEVRRVYHIDRGYERIDERLGALGAGIVREVQPKAEPVPADW